MKPQLKIEITERSKPDEIEFVIQQLLQFNSRFTGENNSRSLFIFLRNADDSLVGGLIASTYSQWLYVKILWIQESYRGEGYGSSLLSTAEQEAIKRGCQYSYLDTFSFQAPEFYQKLGYVVFGELLNFPVSHNRLFLRKVLK